MSPLHQKILIIVITFFIIISLGIFAYIILNHSKEKSKEKSKSKEVWNSEKIEHLSDSLLSSLNSDPDSTDEFKNFCFTKKNTDCIANVISKNYAYLSSYATNPNTVLEDEKMRKLYSAACLRDCYGVKGNWTAQFFNAMVAIMKNTDICDNPECCVKYMETNADPLDLIDTPIFTKVTKDALNSCNKSNSCISSSCYGLQCGDKNECQETCEDCTICKCPFKKACKDGKCIDQNVNTDSSCIPNCSHKNCGDSDGCKDICSDCTNCFCGPTNVCSYGKCNSCRPNSNLDGKCGANTDDCGGSCDCSDEKVCSQGQCVTINTPTNGWDKLKIQNLSDAIYKFMYLSQPQKPVGSISYNYLCVTKKTAFCIANSIANNYQYDPKYISDVKTLPDDSQKYINLCLSNCLGTKGDGNWATPFYDEILYKMILNKGDPSNATCYMKKLEENTDPVDFFQALVDINQTIDNKKEIAASNKLRDIYKIPNTCIQKNTN
jgi:hypothetical protein